ncbi:hypothetical protein HNP77_002311 [Treponema rectale]|uniref:Histidine kinase-, DNA gyrase B-, and HSP90-like ATPase n=1 Tax=Treponema rectale TaxID=744512 RepID=A0A840SKP5_9SPIR|nr:ATP-binding protein [Treponema rectale]MBB5219922.1 hypothetical protein [Treponema rectale]
MAKKINIRPTTGVYATYKNIRYEPWTAIAEFVDNATQSYYDHVEELERTKDWKNLRIEIQYKKDSYGNYELTICDNAFGMNFKDFQRAIILDSKPQIATRSEFGMGLKTSACWFGNNWSVETVELNSGKKFFAQVDVESLSKTKDEEIEFTETECDLHEHGTTIHIWNLNRSLAGRQIQKTKDQLRGIYRRDLQSEKIKISYNDEYLTYETPEIYKEALPGGNFKEWKEPLDFDIFDERKQKYHVTGFMALLETGSTYGAGFTLLRRGRVIIGGYENCYRPKDVFSSSNTYVYQRLFGELNLDNFPVTQTKDSFDWYNNGLEESLINKLVEVTKDYKRKASEYNNTNKKNQGNPVNIGIDNKTLSDFSNAGVIQNVNVNPVENDSSQAEERTQISFASESKDNSLFPDIEEIPIIGNENTKISFDISGRKYILNYSIKKDDSESKWLVVSPQKDNKDALEFDVDWNIAHPFFKHYFENQEIFDSMKKFVFALVLSEIEATYTSSNDKKIEPWDIREKMNETLKAVIRS